MGRIMAKVFDCYDGDRLIMTGTAGEIAIALDIPQPSTVNIYSIKEKKYHKRYMFVFTGEIRKVASVETVEKKKPPTKHEIDLEWIRIALNKSPYYMTGYHNDGREFIDELKAEGITFRTEKHPRDKGYYYLIRT